MTLDDWQMLHTFVNAAVEGCISAQEVLEEDTSSKGYSMRVSLGAAVTRLKPILDEIVTELHTLQEGVRETKSVETDLMSKLREKSKGPAESA